MGPYAGKNGGEIISYGNFKNILSHQTLTADYLNGKKNIVIPKKRRIGNGKLLELSGLLVAI